MVKQSRKGEYVLLLIPVRLNKRVSSSTNQLGKQIYIRTNPAQIEIRQICEHEQTRASLNTHNALQIKQDADSHFFHLNFHTHSEFCLLLDVRTANASPLCAVLVAG